MNRTDTIISIIIVMFSSIIISNIIMPYFGINGEENWLPIWIGILIEIWLCKFYIDSRDVIPAKARGRN